LAQAPDPIFALNLQGEVISSNDAALRLFAEHRGLKGQSALLLFSQSARPEIENLFVRARAGDIVQKHETVITTGEQTLRRAAISLAAIRGEQNQIVGFAMTMRDITQLREAENKLREARQELAQVARRTALAAMSAAIAHEIKQPLGAIVANANAGLRWLSRTPPNLAKARDTFTDIVTDGHRLSEVIQSVRAMFTRGDQAVMALDVNEIIRDTIALMRGELEALGIAVQLELAPQLPLVCGHKVQLQQVMLNIVANAADAMRAVTDRHRALRIESAPAEQGGVAVEVADSGTGIDPQNMAQIFNTFFTTKPNGMGIGLAISRSIVEAHGGTLSASAGMPHGSVFRIVLPSEQQ
jgi:PAS domain S-box-containing protein